MSRVRLTDKVAADMKSKANTQVEDKGANVDNDVHDMNNTGHEKNDPKVDQYAKGGPSEWAEDVDSSNLWKKDKRDDMNVSEMTAKQAAEAVAAAKKLEEKAIKCIVASQRMLPGAMDTIIEAQAADLMHLPENSLNATLARQEELAKSLVKTAAKAEDDADEGDTEKDDEKKDDEKKDDKKNGKKVDFAEMFKKMEAQMTEIKEAMACKEKEATEEAVEAAKVDEKEDEKKEVGEEEEVGAAVEKTVEASDSSLLDDIFSQVTASEKKGAKTLSGMVKKEASENVNDNLSNLWKSDPDVSTLFR